MTKKETFRIEKRFLVKDEGWKLDAYEVVGTFEEAGREASGAARALDERFGDDHFWTVDVKTPDGRSSYVQLFHGRLS